MAILVLNDHVLKAAVPSQATGKLSDIAGLVVFPLLLVTAIELLRPTADRSKLVLASIVISLIGFTLVKTTATGAAAFGWGIGASQWFVTLGVLRDAPLSPAQVVVDPTDLLALPALGVAWWIATRPSLASLHMSGHRRPSALALASLIIAGLASMATSQGVPSVNADFAETLTLTKGAPVAVRRLEFDVAPGEDPVSSVTFTAGAYEKVTEDGNEFLAPSTKVRLSVIPDPAEVAIPADQAYLSPAVDLTKLCIAGCQHGVTVLVQLAPDAQEESVEIELDASVWVSGEFREGNTEPMDGSVSLVADQDGRFDGAPPTVRTSIDGVIEVNTGNPATLRHVTLKVDRSALAGPLAFPLVGRFAVRVELESASGHPNAGSVTLTVQGDDDWLGLDGDSGAVDVDWLNRCEAGKACTVTLELEATYDPSMNAPISDNDDPGVPPPTESAPGFVRLHWIVEANLQALDGRDLPAGALELTSD